jgi:hypothetical protein
MPEEFSHRAQAYASRYRVSFVQQLGVGIHGLVMMGESPLRGGRTAIKFHREELPYLREVEVYQRLCQHSISKIQTLNVPQLLRFDDELLAIEMTVVKKPYLLDFAGAYLDQRPEFAEDIWRTWEKDKPGTVRCALAGCPERHRVFGGLRHLPRRYFAKQYRV